MTILQIPVPENTAERFQLLSEQQQSLVSQLVADCLSEPSSLADVMDYISFKATQRGLTPTILQQLLNEE
ncbi:MULTISPECIES: hypothetical protein [Spirosoma]|uniref:CopG family transcriptional regulator n=1 Tax=Spirosoma liriopis TaxID=2937440 RepID=A0ABT0HW17_9BACT|nr:MULTISPECIES: hypothetical protein [Spirosoma]MCK8495803.1 hypothetical protein [Spirosoma liriopis]UHG94975.1 hypothetical protein LQ777_30255 [Spirosoma oryzicola]